MKCERIEKKLIGYVDERANAAERREVEAHLAVCAACRTRAEEFRLLWKVLDEAPALEPSALFDARLRTRIASEPPRAGLWTWLTPAPRLAFAVSLLLLLSAWITSVPPAGLVGPSNTANSETEFRMIRDLPVLEDYDVLANFEALSALPSEPENGNREM